MRRKKPSRRCWQCNKTIASGSPRRTCRVYGPRDDNPKTRLRVEVCAACKKECGRWV